MIWLKAFEFQSFERIFRIPSSISNGILAFVSFGDLSGCAVFEGEKKDKKPVLFLGTLGVSAIFSKSLQRLFIISSTSAVADSTTL